MYVDEAHTFLDSLIWSFKVYGKYERKEEYGGAYTERPVYRRDLTQLDPMTRTNISGRPVKHIYTYDLTSRNPRIVWDKSTKEGQEEFFFPDLPESETKFIRHLNFEYIFSKNPRFDLNSIREIGYQMLLPRLKEEILNDVTVLLTSLGINIVSKKDLAYKNVVANLFTSSPYYIKRATDPEQSYDSEPGKTFTSGYDYFPLISLLSIFKNINLVSASFNNYHKNIFGYINVSVTKSDVETMNKTIRDDFGSIVLNSNTISSNLMHKISSGLGTILHFSRSIKETDSK